MRSGLFFVVVALFGCGRLRFDEVQPDAGFGSFGTPHKVAELESPEDEIGPSMSANQLEIMFASTRPPASGAFLLWDATRTATDQPWSNLVQTTFTATTASSEPALSDDGLQLYFRRNSAALAFVDRPGPAVPWDIPTVATELTGMEGLDYIGDLRAVMSDVAGNLFEATRSDRAAMWSTPAMIGELVTGDKHTYPTASADGLEMFFQDDSSGVQQLARAVRPTIDQPFGAIEPIDVGFPTLTVGDPELSHDGHTLLFVVKDTDYEIYEMSR